MTRDSDKITHSHDWFFKEAMSNHGVAREFFEMHLPHHILNKVDLSTLKLEKTSFLDNVLGEGYVDMLFSVQFDNKLGYFYLLAEQQTSPDYWMAFRIAKYMLRICDEHLKKYPKAKLLPLVYPMIFYNGTQSYNVPQDLWNLFTNPDLAKLFFIDPFQLIELQKIDDKDLLQKLKAGVMAYMMKHIYDANILPAMESIKPLLSEIGHDDYFYLEAISWYIIRKAESTNARSAFELLKESLPQEKRENFMTIADQFIKEGFEKGVQSGIQTGIAQGLEKGKLESKLEIAQKMLSANVLDINTIAKITDIPVEQLKNLRH